MVKAYPLGTLTDRTVYLERLLGLSTSELFQGSDYVYQWSWGLGDLRQWFIKGVRAMTH